MESVSTVRLFAIEVVVEGCQVDWRGLARDAGEEVTMLQLHAGRYTVTHEDNGGYKQAWLLKETFVIVTF